MGVLSAGFRRVEELRGSIVVKGTAMVVSLSARIARAISTTHMPPYRDSHTARDLSNCGKRLNEKNSGFM